MPFFGVALLVDGGDSIAWRLTAFVIFVVAMITDKIDGDIARSRGLITDFGKIADPIADKAMTGMAFVGLADHLRQPVVVGGDHRGAGPGVERDPAPALRAQEGGDRRRQRSGS